jgi:hypothetical protein
VKRAAERDDIKVIVAELLGSFGRLPLFDSDRLTLLNAISAYGDLLCDLAGARYLPPGSVEAASPGIWEADRFLHRLQRTIRLLIQSSRKASQGDKVAVDQLTSAFEAAEKLAILMPPLQYLLRRGAWGTATYDDDSRELTLSEEEDEITRRESLHSRRLRDLNHATVRETLSKPLSPAPTMEEPLATGLDRLNPEYSMREFSDVMTALRARVVSNG